MRVSKMFHTLMMGGMLLTGCGQLPAPVALPIEVAPTAAMTGSVAEEGAPAVSGGDRQVASLSTLRPIPARQALVARDLAYGGHAQQKLDVYGTREQGARRPVVVYVHGGGWRMGDKAQQMTDKPTYFNGQGYVFVSVNYRLADPGLPVGVRPMHPDQVRDVASSLAWLRNNVARYGGDPARIALIGHSAGAHLAALVASNPRFLNEVKFPFSSLKGVIANDTGSYDLTTSQGGDNMALIENAFGKNPWVLRDASPLLQVKSGQGAPAFLVFVQGGQSRVDEARAFHDASRRADPQQPGDRFEPVRLPGYDHNGMNTAVGRPGERVITPVIETFLKKRFGV